MSDSDGHEPPEWDADLYAERVASYVDANTNNTAQGPTVGRGQIAQFVSRSLDGAYVDTAIEAALDRELLVEAEDGRYALADEGDG